MFSKFLPVHRMKMVLRPSFNPKKEGIPTLRDYKEVPHVDTLGTFRLVDMLTGPELIAMATLRKQLGG